ncbi:MAG: ATP-binding protein [Candidatus Omnitrophota bacterium]|nr:ATP-binding protein [Candidatus Omnitrophota bacterium]
MMPRHVRDRRSSRGLSFLILLSGGLLGALGLVVLVGWFRHDPLLLQVRAAFPPMQPNTALLFVLSGMGLCAVSFGHSRLIQLCGGLVLGVALLTLSQEFHHLELGIDTLLVRDAGQMTTIRPGRMSSFVALCFTCAGGGLLLMGFAPRFRHRALVFGFIGATIATLGSVTLLGYLTGMWMAFWEGAFMCMAAHTAAGFIVMGLGVLALAWRESKVTRTGAPYWPVVVVAVVVAILTLWRVLQASEQADIRKTVSVELTAAHQEINAEMQQRLLALVHMANYWRVFGFSEAEWQYHANTLMRQYPGYRFLAWLDTTSAVRGMVPSTEEGARLEELIRSHARSQQTLNRAVAEDSIRISPPIEFAGQPAFFAAVPLYRSKSRLQGTMIAMFQVGPLMKAMLSTPVDDLSMLILSEEEELYTHTNRGRTHETAWAQERMLQLPGITWRVRMWPTPAQLRKWDIALPEAVLGGGLLIALLLGSACYFAQISQARARGLEQKNQQLLVEMMERRKAQQDLLSASAHLEQSYHELETAHLRLIQSEKMDSVGRLAAGVAHEVKNPLAALAMGVEYLTTHLPPMDGEVTAVLQDMEEAVTRANHVIQGLLDFSAPRKLQRQREDLREVISEALSLLKHEFTKAHVTVVPRWARTLPPVELDRNKIIQVFINLFMNAIHAMPEGGTLTIRTSTKQLGGAGEVLEVVAVEDTGTGIPEDKLEHVFEPFFTTKSQGQGNGLGLAVTKEIIQLHGGAITLQNRPEGGMQVMLLFPLPSGEPREMEIKCESAVGANT